MTIALAVYKNKEISIATDSMSTFGALKVCENNYSANKVVKCGETYIASCGWGKYDNILRDYLKGKKSLRLPDENAVFLFFHELWDEMHRSYTLVNEQCEDKDSPFGDLDASFLVANKNGIFHVTGNMSVTKFENYFAIGAGQEYAMGAMRALYDSRMSAESIAKKACEIAITFNIYCGGKPKFYTLKAK